MEELAKVQAQLAECRRHSDNHRRSRDYHKEQSAELRKDIQELQGDLEFWKDQHTRMDNAFVKERRDAHLWSTIAFVFIGFSIGMTVLFFWALRS